MASVVRVQTQDFDVGAEIAALRAGNPMVGAVASFIGCVRDMNQGDAVGLMYLEHYPGMTEREIEKIAAEACSRWDIFDTLIIHRVGELKPLDQIVFVAVTSAHRGDSFAACEFIMDILKTKAPFWKREATPAGNRWVDARASDDAAAERWTQS
jgi:molybdopterin synthase catalytic subunit